jgi:hypothetical protein
MNKLLVAESLALMLTTTGIMILSAVTLPKIAYILYG